MKLKDMLTTLRTISYERLELRDDEGDEILTCPTLSDAVKQYILRGSECMNNDLISRSELLGKFMTMLTFSSDRVVLIENVIKQIQNAPTVEPLKIYEFKGCDNCELERPQGEWIYNQYDDWHCSECRHIEIGGYNQKPSANFCPNCGAKMKQD